MQFVLDNSQANVRIWYEISVPTMLGAQLCFYIIDLMSRVVSREKLNMVRNEMISSQAGIAAQIVQNACDVPTGSSLFRKTCVVIQPYS